MVEVAGLLFVFILSVTLAMGAALAALGVLLEVMRRTAVRPSSDPLIPCRNRPLDAPVQRCRGILSQPRRPRLRRRDLSFLGDPAARAGRSAFRRIVAPTVRARYRSFREERRKLAIDWVGEQRRVTRRQRIEVAAQPPFCVRGRM
jgi:hypothetical protein